MSIERNKPACPEWEPLLGALLTPDVTDEEREQVEEHVEACQECGAALGEARRGAAALGILAEAPLPYLETSASESSTPRDVDELAWRFKKRIGPLPSGKAGPRPKRAMGKGRGLLFQFAAAAAMVVFGIAIGRWTTPTPPERTENVSSADSDSIRPEAVDALARAELLSDVGTRYVEGLEALLVDVMSLSDETASVGELGRAREGARELIRDGRLLLRSVEGEKDAQFLAAIRRAELFLEELAVVDGGPGGTGVLRVQASLRDSGIEDRLAAVDLDREVEMAIDASGWLGQELAARKDF